MYSAVSLFVFLLVSVVCCLLCCWLVFLLLMVAFLCGLPLIACCGGSFCWCLFVCCFALVFIVLFSSYDVLLLWMGFGDYFLLVTLFSCGLLYCL